MLFEDGIENIIGSRNEKHRRQEQSDRNENIAQIRAEGINRYEDERQQCHHEQAAVEIHRSGSRQQHPEIEKQRAQCQRSQINHAGPPLSVHHRLGKRTDQNQHHQQGQRRKEERKNKEYGDQDHRNTEPLVQTFAVQHEQQRYEHDTRSCIVLHDDNQQRQTDHQSHLEKIPRPVDRKRAGAHHAGQRQRRSDFGELHRLNTDRPDLEPGLRTVHFTTEQQSGYQGQQSQDIEQISPLVIDARIDQQHDDRYGERYSHPDELFHIEMREGKNALRPLFVRSGEDSHEADQHDQHIDQHCPAIDALEQFTDAVIFHRPGNKSFSA